MNRQLFANDNQPVVPTGSHMGINPRNWWLLKPWSFEAFNAARWKKSSISGLFYTSGAGSSNANPPNSDGLVRLHWRGHNILTVLDLCPLCSTAVLTTPPPSQCSPAGPVASEGGAVLCFYKLVVPKWYSSNSCFEIHRTREANSQHCSHPSTWGSCWTITQITCSALRKSGLCCITRHGNDLQARREKPLQDKKSHTSSIFNQPQFDVYSWATP